MSSRAWLPVLCLLAFHASAAAGEDPDEPLVTEDEMWEAPIEGSAGEAPAEDFVSEEELWDEPSDEEAGGVRDPWEGLNRATFAFNEWTDRWVLEPLAIGWDTVLPEFVQTGIDNFFDNLGMSRRIANDIMQGKAEKTGDDFGRFLVNTTFGIGGLFDVATDLDFPQADEDFGQTLGVWGVPAGPYLVIPFLGPSNPRDATGLAVEGFVMTPEYYLFPFYVSYIATGTRLLNDRALAIETLRAERAAAFDFYTAVRSAYVQYRDNQVRDRADVPDEVDEDLYYFDDEEFEDDEAVE